VGWAIDVERLGPSSTSVGQIALDDDLVKPRVRDREQGDDLAAVEKKPSVNAAPSRRRTEARIPSRCFSKKRSAALTRE